jgi:hypothetical protein
MAALILSRPDAGDIDIARQAVGHRRPVVALTPDPSFCAAFAVSVEPAAGSVPGCFSVPHRDRPAVWRRVLGRVLGAARPRSPRLRTLHPWVRFRAREGNPELLDARGNAAWWWSPVAESGVLFVGTELVGDLVRYRQGDPAAVSRPGPREKWGYPGERPNYLFEAQRAGEPPHTRHADEWTWFATGLLADRSSIALDHVLPDGAPGAVVLTGDDDQAALACYQQQLSLIDGMPITYFLHPRTKHTPHTLRTMLSRRGIELGLHPDALDAPDEYEARFREQATWFRSLVGHPARAVRNHGFLNGGYWNHLRAWLDGGVEMSSNLPGFDGTVLNGSLLPARMCFEGRLTEHWSILTAIGDGVMFAGQWTPERAAAGVLGCAQQILASGIPGVLVLNLHPENISANRGMHLAAMEVSRSGFIPWTLGECREWFAGRDVE